MDVRLARKTMEMAHAGQTDHSGKLYREHPLGVMWLLPEDASHVEIKAALLHDVLEDSDYTEDDLLAAGAEEELVEVLRLLTRDESFTYLDWIRTIAESGNRAAIRVKIADNRHNLDEDRLAVLPESKKHLPKRYRKALEILRHALARLENKEKDDE